MPLYAANNILRGINGVAGIEPRVLGIFHNVRDNDADLSAAESLLAGRGIAHYLPTEPKRNRSGRRTSSRPLVRFAPQSEEVRRI